MYIHRTIQTYIPERQISHILVGNRPYTLSSAYPVIVVYVYVSVTSYIEGPSGALYIQMYILLVYTYGVYIMYSN